MQWVKTIKKCLLIGLPLAMACGLSSCIPVRLTTDDIYGLQKKANRGDAKAQVMIGEIYEFGTNVPLNHLIAAQWYQLAAKRDDPEAQFYLGVIYERGIGLKRNTPEALKWLFMAAEQGHERAQIMLAILYLKDKELRPEFSKKIDGYRQKAEKGDADAQYNLAWSYMEGAGQHANVREALKWYQRASEKGSAKAQLALGGIYLDGKGVPASSKEALVWYRKSARTDIKAQVKLYQLYQGTRGVAENEEAAERYLKTISRKTDASLSSYIRMQRTILSTQTTANPVMALRACSRMATYDPEYGDVSDACKDLKKEVRSKTVSRIQEVQTALEQKDRDQFRYLFDRLLSPDFDESQFRGFIVPAWKMVDEENRATEKIAQEQLRALEATLKTASHRTRNVQQIYKLIATFKETVLQGLRDNPGDETLTALWRKGKRVTASLLKKIKAPPPPEEKTVAIVEPPEEPAEEADPGEDDYTKAQELFSSGHFQESAAFFEKTTKTRGSKYIASAYIYLGITHLARINPANVNDARRRHLKGLACFQNALRFDSTIALPDGYNKYQSVFDEAKKRLH